jgi:tetratricopeptide (TPR) repeat protein
VYRASPDTLELLRLYEGGTLLIDGNVEAAAVLLASIDRKVLHPRWHPRLLANLALALAEKGESEKAVLVARESMGTAVSSGAVWADDDLRTYQLTALGVSLVAAGSYAEAIEPLEQALVRGGESPRGQATRAFYLGEALLGLGRTADAERAWRRAAECGQASRFVDRAQDRLAARVPYRT